MSVADRTVMAEVARWTAVVLVGATGLAGLGTAVDGVSQDPSRALTIGLLRAPGLIAMLTPLLVALAAALASARMAARGERVALSALGFSPVRLARPALLVGLLAGLLGFVASGWLVPSTEQAADALSDAEAPGWVWTQEAAVRVSDGLQVRVRDGRIQDLGRPKPPADLAAARMLQRPRTASADALRDATLVPARLERSVRRARVLACALFAWLGWLPLSRRPAAHVGAVLGLATTWTALDLTTQAAAAQGQLGPVPGAWLATGLLGLALMAHALRSYFTCSQ